MTARQAFNYSTEFKNVGDAWSHIVFLLSYSAYIPKDYSPKTFSEELAELFNEYVKYGFVYINEKGNWVFKDTSIEEAISEINIC